MTEKLTPGTKLTSVKKDQKLNQGLIVEKKDLKLHLPKVILLFPYETQVMLS